MAVGQVLVKTRDGRADFQNVRVGGESLRLADPDAIILPRRERAVALATAAVEVALEEPVALVYACTDLYMTAMGRAVFGGEIARRLFGAGKVTSYLRYRTDNSALRDVIEQLPHVALPKKR